MTLRQKALAAGTILVLAGLAAWYQIGNSRNGRAGMGRPPVTVRVAKAVLADVPVTLEAIGTVQPVVTATIRTQLAGTLFSVDFTEGQQVTKGQLLARIDPRPYELALAQGQANLARDEATLGAARADLERYRTLLAQDSIASQQVDTQAALVKQLEGTVAADRAALGTAKLNLTYASIRAPVSGRVGLRQADLGNYLTPADAAGVAVIAQTTPIDVAFSLPQSQLPMLQQRLAIDPHPGVTARDQDGVEVLAEGTFLTLDNLIDATSGTVKAKARFANPEGRLFPNQFVNVVLQADLLHQAVTVPVGALRHGVQGDFVFVVQPDHTVKLEVVTTGPSQGESVVILTGLSGDATVVTEGADGLDAGSRVVLPGDQHMPGRRTAGGTAP